MQVPTWRNVLNLKNVLVPSVSGTRIAAIHSTPVNFEKWKSKRNDDAKKEQKPSKNHIRYAVRQKRADTKRALRGLVYDYGSWKPFQQGGVPRMSSFNSENLDSTAKTRRPKNPAKSAKKSYQKKIKRKFRRDYFSEDEDDPATVFHARFGKKWFTWSFHHSSFRGTTSEFEWTEPPNWSKFKAREWDTTGDAESDNSDDDEPCSVGSTSDRTILGLPPTGPLKIDEVKTAFRLSALKWHPDKHQGPSQATAEEKFKLCVNAYKSLCSALS